MHCIALALEGTPVTELWDVTCRMRSHSYLLRDKWMYPALTISLQVGTQFTYPRGMEDLLTCTCTWVVMDFSRLSLYCPYPMVFQWASKRFLKELTEVALTTCWGSFSWDQDGICWQIAWDCVREDHVSCLRVGRAGVSRCSPFLSKSCSTRWDHLVASSPPMLLARLNVVFDRRRNS